MYFTIAQAGIALRTITTHTDEGPDAGPVAIWLHFDGPDGHAGFSLSLGVEEAIKLVGALDLELIGLGAVGISEPADATHRADS